MGENNENNWEQRSYYMGLDWAKQYHEIVVVDGSGRIMLDLRIKHTAEGWHRLRVKLIELAGLDLSVVATAIETNRGPAVERLLELGCTIYPLNPKAAQRYRDRKAPSGGKTDHLDALSFADALKKAGKRRWEKFLHTHRLYRPETYQKRLDVFARATEFCGRQAVTNAKSMLAMSLAKQLRLLSQQLKVYRKRIEELFGEHPDYDLFGSLPGVAEKLGPRLLSECGEDRDRFADHQALQCYAGTAPVSFQSGQIHKVKFRYACNKNLRAAVHLWSDLSRARCAWAQIYYQQKRLEGKSHACSLRCLGQRWLKILWKMWQTKKPYDERMHMRNQLKHGSWVLAMNAVGSSAK